MSLALAYVAASGAAGGGRDRLEGPFGRGAAQVWILLPAGAVRNIVVFGHGWKVFPPSAAHPWVGQFRPWLDHLAGRGAAIVFPRYQLGAGDLEGVAQVSAYRAGLTEAFLRLHARARHTHPPVIVFGYSYGASLAFTYAADAGGWRLPAASAVDAVFPAGMIPGVTLPTLAPGIRVLVQVGDADTEAGSGGANAFWAWLAGHQPARKRYELVRSTGGFVASHAAPKGTSAAAKRAFWRPLDELIATVDRSGPRLW
jgi:dienelactone hydrolase